METNNRNENNCSTISHTKYNYNSEDGNNENFEEQLPQLKVSHPLKLLRLCGKLTDTSTKELEIKINEYLRNESKSKIIFLINLLSASEEAVVQTVNNIILDTQIRLPLSDEIINKLKNFNKQCLNLKNFDKELNQLIEIVLNNLNENENNKIILIPFVISNNNFNNLQQILLVTFVNCNKPENFLIDLVDETFRYCITILLNTAAAEEEARQKIQCHALLSMARKLFSHLNDLNDLLKEIMSEARRLTNAERCSLFLLDPDHMHLVAKVFDGVSSNEANQEVRIAKNQGIAGHVVATGKLLNIKNAYEHPLFYKGMDEATGFKTRNILCFPICDENKIIGVAQLCNKNGGNFNYFDEEMAKAFSIYCGLSIMHSLVYKEIQDAQARSKLSNELMMYHMQISEDDIHKLLHCSKIHHHPNFDDFNFSPRLINNQESLCFTFKMFENLNFISKFHIKKETLARFILFIKKGYRDTPYHNWMHAFSVMHFAYLCLKNFNLIEKGYISHLDALAYLISCMCHDLDHRGTTNSYQEHSDSILANLYSSEGSVMEHHHLSQTLCTLNTEGCNILESLSRDDYIQCLDLIKDMILATDLSTHFKIYKRQSEMAEEGYNFNNKEHKYAFICLLMTCADLSDQIKEWSVTKKIAQLVYEEFFTEGDLEKQMGQKPSAMMDRETASIPDLQIDFLNDVCLPVFKILGKLFPEAQTLVIAIENNIECWVQSKKIFEKFCQKGRTSWETLISPDLEVEVEAIMKNFNK